MLIVDSTSTLADMEEGGCKVDIHLPFYSFTHFVRVCYVCEVPCNVNDIIE